ncbi:MAG: hypothetical protein KME22_06680 [Hassallia sp. WJT32-NPBG1]|nr:hypothetical protein [Hassallia sp. WJT32-NPBG1]
MTKDFSIDSKKVRAAVMLCRGVSQAIIVSELGISRRTLLRWTQEPEFKELKNNIAEEFTQATVETTKQGLTDSAKQVITYEQKKFFISEQCSQLDKAINAIMHLVEGGDLFAIDRLVKLCDRKSRLLGLDQKTVDVAVAVNTLAQFGVITHHQASAAFGALDEASEKLSRIGADQ